MLDYETLVKELEELKEKNKMHASQNQNIEKMVKTQIDAFMANVQQGK